jgi:methylamine--corrinoid protein Co-methyltransferase
MPVSFWEILQRSKEGPIVEEKQFDLNLFKKAQQLIKKYGIKYEPGKPVDTDGDLSDRIYQAGVEMFLDLGTYCTSTRRIIKVSETELKEEMNALPTMLEVGQGADRVCMAHREVEGPQDCIVVAGIQTAPFSNEEMMFKISKLCAEDRCVDGIWGGILLKIDGKYPVVAGAPSEIYQYRRTAEILRNAVAAAGRPGMIIINNAPTSVATIGLFDEQRGMRSSDIMEVTGMSELKVTYDDLNRTAFGMVFGIKMHGAHIATIGGFSGNPEGAAITAVAGVMQSLAVQKGDCFRCGVTDSRIKSRVTRSQLWVVGAGLQGLSRNTKLILDGSIGDHPAAGPGTRQYLYEAAAGFIVSTVMGSHSVAGTRKYVVGEVPNYGTPLESRWMGEVCKGAVGMSRAQADVLVKYLLDKYENNLKDAPAGQTFEALYDQQKLEPTAEYQKLYDEVKAELRGLGLQFRS